MRRRGLIAGAALAGAVSLAGAAPAQPAADLLRDYRPVLAYDSREEHFAQPVSRSVETIDRDVIYGHLAIEDGVRYLQYWLFYSQNTQDRGILATGRHEGDWEFVQLRLGPGGTPEAATFAHGG